MTEAGRRPRGPVRDELLAAVCTAAMRELAGRMAAGVARVRGKHGDPAAARRRLGVIGNASSPMPPAGTWKAHPRVHRRGPYMRQNASMV